ncbi:branched-chain amino acid aminotransferase [Pontibacter sp. SGAir0037]|uniref:branched-chain amino acid aminotransferase n=1 Tax=Pontibacter sp. SGAir0037 TaxID=2571030 RepID=UPI0010CCED74|nr:branched-chain amino acid aminotransferase [Pontibacter sp. SGAir0037]QCR23340.1 branched chain amino acid aminotransferase [Pontibacter sp. SGAir0037]
MSVDTFTIPTQQVAKSRVSEVDFENLVFGKTFSDHMFVVDYVDGAWQNAQILPYGNMSMSPATSALHYGQAIFEGMKAYRDENDDILLFRPLDNHKRLNASAQRLCMPELPEELFMQGLEQLLRLDAAWVPSNPGCALYLRPFMFATDAFIGVRPSLTYRFAIITCPVGAYFDKPVKVAVETNYVRSAEGGAGYAKAAGNYAAALLPTQKMHERGFQQLIWTDAREHKYIEESGTMNVMFVIDNVVVTPSLSTSILHGVTRSSVLQVAKDLGYTVEERKVSVDEVIEAYNAGKLQEAFGTGTAAVISQIALIHHNGQDCELPPVETRTISNSIAAELDKIRTGKAVDSHGWVYKISL